jgi:hypothetical protein
MVFISDLLIFKGLCVSSKPKRPLHFCSSGNLIPFLLVVVTLCVFLSMNVETCSSVSDLVGTFRLVKRGMTYSAVLRRDANSRECGRLRLSVGSWLASNPSSRVLLFLNRSDFCPAMNLPDVLDVTFGRGRVLYVGLCRTNPGGIQYVNDWFAASVRLAPTSYLSLICGDDIVTAEWATAVVHLLDSIAAHFRPFITTPRWDVDANESAFSGMDYSAEHFNGDFRSIVKTVPHHPRTVGGIDIFTFNRLELPLNLDRFPDFLAGRPPWDNWLLAWANRCATTFSPLFDPPIYHFEHDGHLRSLEDPTVKYNYEVFENAGGGKDMYFQVKWYLKHGKLVPGPVPLGEWKDC